MSTTPLANTFAGIDALNNEDPNKIIVGDSSISKEVLYSQRMQQQLNRFSPNASEELQIAAYGQHVKRWAIPRSDYPMNRAGYKRWRTDLGQYHATTVAEVMQATGYNADSIARVQHLLQKKQLKRDTETQTLEDIICLVFLEYYLNDFAKKHNEEKLIDIIQKTWRKMSDKGHSAALQLPLDEHLLTLVAKALA